MRFATAAAPILAVALLLCAGSAARAEATRMTARDIQEALIGNTLAGIWGNTPFRTFLQPDGVMYYRPRGGGLEIGKWRIDEENDQYCAWTVKVGWRCYELYRDGPVVYWSLPGSDERHRSRLIGGRLL